MTADIAAAAARMGTTLPNLEDSVVRLPDNEQPIETKFEMVDGIACVMMAIQRAGTYVPQHSHEYAHISALVSGSIEVWKDGVNLGTFVAPHQLVIEAHAKHLFLAIDDNTTILCIHNASRSGEIEIAEKHNLF